VCVNVCATHVKEKKHVQIVYIAPNTKKQIAVMKVLSIVIFIWILILGR
jgi:hypothetical protein